MSYRPDQDLDFLQYSDNEDLEILVNYITKSNSGSVRWTEELTENDKYKKYNPDHKQYWNVIAAEIQKYGGNTIANIFRGDMGVPYRKVLINVCKKMKVNINSQSPIDVIEMNLLFTILTKSALPGLVWVPTTCCGRPSNMAHAAAWRG